MRKDPTEKRAKRGYRIRWGRVFALIASVAVVVAGGSIGTYHIFHTAPKTKLPMTASSNKTATLAHSRRADSAQAESARPSSADESPSALENVTSLPSDEKIAFLTFDDGPSQYTSTLLNTLQQNGIKATFFITFFGHDSSTKRGWVSQELADGETIGEHSWTHNYSYIYSSEQNFMADFGTMKRILTEITGAEPKLFRFPGGVSNTVSLRYHNHVPIMSALVQDVENAGMKPFDWTAGGEDAARNAPSSPQQFCDLIMNDVGSQMHPIILMHDRIENSVNTVPLLIQALRAKGYSFATLSPSMEPVLQKAAK